MRLLGLPSFSPVGNKRERTRYKIVLYAKSDIQLVLATGDALCVQLAKARVALRYGGKW
jgi:hypothetical protein